MDKKFFVYILTNKHHTVLYTGITNILTRRIYEHKNKLVDGFSKKYNCEKLVWYEIYDDSFNAISREKQIKGGSRKKKILLIEKLNPNWEDLSREFY